MATPVFERKRELVAGMLPVQRNVQVSPMPTFQHIDTKLDGIPAKVLAAALLQAKEARLAILNVMNAAIDRPDEINPLAPRIMSIKIPVDQIGAVIGPKGKVINQIQEETGAEITIKYISSIDFIFYIHDAVTKTVCNYDIADRFKLI